MESRAKILGHAAHALLIVFPLGLLATAVIFDVIYLFTGNPNLALDDCRRHCRRLRGGSIWLVGLAGNS
jgi:uncharacterized membrane protein